MDEDLRRIRVAIEELRMMAHSSRLSNSDMQARIANLQMKIKEQRDRIAAFDAVRQRRL